MIVTNEKSGVIFVTLAGREVAFAPHAPVEIDDSFRSNTFIALFLSNGTFSVRGVATPEMATPQTETVEAEEETEEVSADTVEVPKKKRGRPSKK